MGKAYFNDIALRVKALMESSDREIRIAVAWFTSHFLFRVVENLAEAGKQVTIIISDSPHNFEKLPFHRLVTRKAQVLVCPTRDDRFMHHKFALLDDNRAFSGSYNWSISAESNWENIVEFDEPVLLKQFAALFGALVKQSVPFGQQRPRTVPETSADARKDTLLFALEEQFDQDVNSCIREALRIGVPLQTDQLFRFLDRYGAVGAANILASSEEGTHLQPGFKKLARRGRLDLTFEGQIIRPKFSPLFSEKVIDFAKKKLDLGKIESQLSPEK